METLLKGILLWMTIIMCLTVSLSIDSIFENTLVGILCLLACAVLIVLCTQHLTGEEAMHLSGADFLNKLLGYTYKND